MFPTLGTAGHCTLGPCRLFPAAAGLGQPPALLPRPDRAGVLEAAVEPWDGSVQGARHPSAQALPGLRGCLDLQLLEGLAPAFLGNVCSVPEEPWRIKERRTPGLSRRAQILRSGAFWCWKHFSFLNSRSESLYYPFIQLIQICLICC